MVLPVTTHKPESLLHLNMILIKYDILVAKAENNSPPQHKLCHINVRKKFKTSVIFPIKRLASFFPYRNGP